MKSFYIKSDFVNKPIEMEFVKLMQCEFHQFDFKFVLPVLNLAKILIFLPD